MAAIARTIGAAFCLDNHFSEAGSWPARPNAALLARISISYFGSKCIAIPESDRSNVLHFLAILCYTAVFNSIPFCTLL